MSYVDDLTGNVNLIDSLGEITSVKTSGDTVVINAIGSATYVKAQGKLGIGQTSAADGVKNVFVDGKSVVDENGNANINGFIKDEQYSERMKKLEDSDVDLKSRMTNLEKHGENIYKSLEDKADRSEIPDTSNFIKNTVDNLVNYYLKSEVYNKEEINELASTLQNVSITIVDNLPSEGKTNVIYFVKKTGKENDIYNEWIYINNAWEYIGNTQVDLTGYATEKWVKNQNYMPIPDFQEYMNYFYYNKTQIDEKLENLPEPTIPLEFDIDANIVEEEGNVRVYTNTGYIVSDKDIRLQAITSSGTTGDNKMVYTDDEVVIIYDGSKRIRRSKNGFKFDVIELPYACKSMFYNPVGKKIFGLANGYFLYSDDDGETWNSKSITPANTFDYITRGQAHVSGFTAINKNTKTVYSFDENLRQTGYIRSVISPDFVTQFSQHQHIWCNSSGTFKYGAGSNEGNFASLSGVTINMLKTINSRQMVGIKNSNKFYIIKNLSGVSDNEWVEYTLPDICTVNDVIFNPYDETYYIFTDINTYYKTKDFIKYDEPVDMVVRGLQGYFTLMGIQMTTSDHDKLLLAPTRTTLEEKGQEWDRLLNKDRWVGPGLQRVGAEQIGVGDSTYIGVNSSSVFLRSLDEYIMPESVLIANKVALAKLVDGLFDPYNMDDWFWNEGYPTEESAIAYKIIFSQDGSFYDPQSYNEEYFVEQYEYGYLYIDVNTGISKYEKLGNLAWLFNMILGG